MLQVPNRQKLATAAATKAVILVSSFKAARKCLQLTSVRLAVLQEERDSDLFL